jgi:hypothetical protein
VCSGLFPIGVLMIAGTPAVDEFAGPVDGGGERIVVRTIDA